MTKRYAMASVPRQWSKTAIVRDIREPTYPDQPIAFRWYPVSWWVHHPGMGLSGRITGESTSRTLHVSINGSAIAEQWPIEAVVSCTARQVAALESTP